jgi:hypothetical protein
MIVEVGEGGDGEEAGACDADAVMRARRCPYHDPPMMGRRSPKTPLRWISTTPVVAGSLQRGKR